VTRRARPTSNPWPSDLPADVQVAMDRLEDRHPRMAMTLIDDILARQKPLDELAFVHVEGLRREHLRKDATMIAIAELSQSVYRHHADPMDAVLAVSEPHLIEARGYRDGVRAFLHEQVMNGFGNETLSSEFGTMPTYERLGAFEPGDVADWPLTFDELVDLTNNLFILRYSDQGGPPTYEAFATKAEEERAWAELELEYADPDAEEEQPRDELRDVNLDGFRLTIWDTHMRDNRGQTIIGYSLRFGTEVIFEGEDFAGSPLHADDSDETLRSILTFLTLRPGDTDAEYFANYTPAQMDFARTDAEELARWAEDDGPDFVDWAP